VSLFFNNAPPGCGYLQSDAKWRFNR